MRVDDASIERLDEIREQLNLVRQIAGDALGEHRAMLRARATLMADVMPAETRAELAAIARDIADRLQSEGIRPVIHEATGTVAAVSDTHGSAKVVPGTGTGEGTTHLKGEAVGHAPPHPRGDAVPMPGPVVSWALVVLAVEQAISDELPEGSQELKMTLTLALVAILLAMIFDDRIDGSGRGS